MATSDRNLPLPAIYIVKPFGFRQSSSPYRPSPPPPLLSPAKSLTYFHVFHPIKRFDPKVWSIPATPRHASRMFCLFETLECELNIFGLLTLSLTDLVIS